MKTPRGIGVLATIGSVLMLAGCGALRPAASPVPAASPSPGPADLAAVVIGSDERPSGLVHDQTILGRPTLTLVVISGRDAEFLALEGFRDGRAAFFSTPSASLLSMALDFSESQWADIALHRYQAELSSSEGYGFGEAQPAIGSEGICDTGENPSLGGLVESICIWRSGRLVLIAGGALPMAEIQQVAETMQDRATP